MSVINDNQGMVKLSEVAADSAQALLATSKNEDGLTVVEQLRRVTTDALRRIGLLLTSRNPIALTPGSISWSGTTISFTTNTNIVIKLLQNENSPAAVIDLVLAYGASNTSTAFNSINVPDGQMLYIELNRSNLASGPVTIENAAGGGSLVVGKTAKVGAVAPVLSSPNSGAQGTITIPLAINIDGAMWWIPHGIFWPAGTSSPLGSVITTTSMPNGTIVDFHRFGASSPLGYETLKAAAPGWQLCDGSVVIDPLSPFRNPTRNDDGTPTGGYNAALDNFTPNLMGPHFTWTNTIAYSAGEYVQFGGVNYVAVNAVSIGGSDPSIDTTNWKSEATYNNTSPANVYNKYRKTTQNQNNNTYTRGNAQNFKAEDGSSYAGENTHILSTPEIPSHTHSFSGTTAFANTTHVHNGITSSSTVPAHGSTDEGGDGTNFILFDDGGGIEGIFTIPSSSHSHSFSTSPAGQTHTHTFSGTTGAQGGTLAHNNEPRYFNALKIIRIY